MIQTMLDFKRKPKPQKPISEKEPRPGTHCDFILNILRNGEWQNTIKIMELRGDGVRNLAVAARVHDLKTRFGYDGLHGKGNIESRISKSNGQGEYRLV